MEGRDHDDHHHDHPEGYLSRLFQSTNRQAPPLSLPPANNNDHQHIASSQQNQHHIVHQNPSKENNIVSLNPNSQSNNYPFYQNPNPQNYLFQNPILQNPTTQSQPSDLYYPVYPYSRILAMEPHMYPNANPNFDPPLNQSTPGPPHQYHYPSFDHFAHNQSSENGLSRLNQSSPVPQYSSTNSSRTSFPLQNYETIHDLQSQLERVKIDDLAGLSMPTFRNLAINPYVKTNNQWWSHTKQQWSDQSRDIEPNHGNSGRRFMFDHLGSSINGSQSINMSASLSRYNNSNVRPRRRSIEELRGLIFLVAKDEQGCRFLQKKVDERNPIDIEIILSEVKDDLHELMGHQSAKNLIQKLIGVLNEEQMTKLILSLVNSQRRLFRVCDDLIGSRVIQKVLDDSEYPQRQPLTPEQKYLLVSALKNITVTLSKSTHGYHVINRCLQKFPYEYTKDLVEEVAENCLSLAIDRNGCRLVQECIKYAHEEQKGRIIADVISDALFLSNHPYGNYVVQYILGLKIPQVTADTLAQFAGNYFTLSQGKCSSHVVEKCLLESGEEQSTFILNEIILHPEIFELMLHPFGNYIVQTAWTLSQGRSIRKTLETLVEMNSPFLQSHMYGKKVLAKVRGNI